MAGDDDEECVLSDDSDYDEPELKYGARQAFAALKARKMGVDEILSKNRVSKKCFAAPRGHRRNGISYTSR